MTAGVVFTLSALAAFVSLLVAVARIGVRREREKQNEAEQETLRDMAKIQPAATPDALRKRLRRW